MEKITLYTCGKNYSKFGSGFAVILRHKTGEWKRSFAYGNYSANQAEMLAIKFALLSISKSYSDAPIVINSGNKYVRDMLEKDEDGYYVKVPKANKELLEEIRELIDNAKEILIISDKNDIYEECVKMAEKTIKSGKQVDIRK